MVVVTARTTAVAVRLLRTIELTVPPEVNVSAHASLLIEQLQADSLVILPDHALVRAQIAISRPGATALPAPP
jgi:hypothetical protein